VAGRLAEDVLSCFDLLVRELRSDFTSSGTLCRGWLYPPAGVTRPPVIVLAQTSQRPWARGRDNVTIRTGPFNHFDPFGRDSEASIATDMAFPAIALLQRNPGRGASKNDR
jgi:hypothetical protein